MAKINIVISHALDRDDALERIKGLIQNAREQFAGQFQLEDIKENWTKYQGMFSFSVRKVLISCNVHIMKKQIIINGKLPLIAIHLKSDIESAIRTQAQALLTASGQENAA
jgi:hypothetical protein